MTRRGFGTRLIGEASYWHARTASPGDHSLYALALIPVLRFAPAGAHASGWFAEIGVGPKLLSQTRIGENRRFATAFQLTEQLNIGWAFGPRGGYEIALTLQHISNARLRQPNDGLTTSGVTLRAAF